MRRLIASICFFFSLTSPVWAGAQMPTSSPSPSPDPPYWVDPFCSVAADYDYWDVPSNRGIDDGPTSYLLGRLYAHGAGVSAHVILLSDTDAYDASISTQPLSGDHDYLRHSTQFLIALPNAMQIRYAYVDSYQLDGGAVVNCPTEANHFEKGIGQNAPADIKTTPTFAASFRQKLPTLTCGKVYRAATVMRAVSPRGIQTGKMLQAKIAIYINSDGSLAKSYVYKKSGVDYADALALDAANRSSYIAAQFLCTPIVGEYLFTADFEP